MSDKVKKDYFIIKHDKTILALFAVVIVLYQVYQIGYRQGTYDAFSEIIDVGINATHY